MAKNLLQGYHHWNYRTMVQEYFISIIFLAKFMAITLTLFLFHSLCCPGNNNTSSEDSNTFAKNVDVFLFWTSSLSDIYVERKTTNVGCGCWQENLSYNITMIPFYSTYRNNEWDDNILLRQLLFILSNGCDCSSSSEKRDINHKKELVNKAEEQIPIFGTAQLL